MEGLSYLGVLIHYNVVTSTAHFLDSKLTIKAVITNDQEHEAALQAIELLLGAEPGTPEWDEFERLSKLIDEYEDIWYPINETVPLNTQ
jgi:HTH-type transcriptional regulator/antitoxin HigA